MYVRMYVRMYVCMYVCTDVYINTYMHTHTHQRGSAQVCVRVLLGVFVCNCCEDLPMRPRLPSEPPGSSPGPNGGLGQFRVQAVGSLWLQNLGFIGCRRRV